MIVAQHGMIGRCRICCAGLVLLLVQACTVSRTVIELREEYIPSEQVSFSSVREIEGAHFDAVWEQVVRFFASGRIPIETIEKDSGIVVAKRLLAAEGNSPYVDRGSVISRARLLRQRFRSKGEVASASFGSAAEGVRILGARALEGSGRETVFHAMYDVVLSFNVFVERFADSRIRLTVNSAFEPGSKQTLLWGWFWPKGKRLADMDSTDIRLELVRGVSGRWIEVEPEPVSTGVFEREFLDAVEEGLR